MMKIKLSDVNNANGKRYKFAFSAAADKFDFPIEDYRINGTLKVSGTVENTGISYCFKGTIECDKHFICDRCLEEVTEKQVHAFKEVYKEKMSVNEPDVNIFSGDFIDITKLVRDIVVAEQPINNLCKPDCKGLCLKCGTNLNKSECNCDDAAADTRLTVLGKLLEKKIH
ncbi:YceD family protein [Pectinatus frisingensis]|uniref:YceD family protein n=1 Tax=Pectinatus frisingensis TaxID=865 RepID=UPI0018C5BEF5|nr:DUF177 domain-containing protein [Pectinatus frisingensis]